MSHATEAPSAASEPNRRAGLVDFFSRLLKEKPLGMFCRIIVLLFIGVAIFADALTPYPPAETCASHKQPSVIVKIINIRTVEQCRQ